MDPFEVRIRFTQQLASLNASVTGASKTAQYALKYRDLDEDLHSCILEQLERVCAFHLGGELYISMGARACQARYEYLELEERRGRGEMGICLENREFAALMLTLPRQETP